MPIYWDPKLPLQVTPEKGHTCTGTTQKGVRCQNPVNKADRAVASRILKDLSEENIMAVGLSGRVSRWIRDLAELTLCKSYHRKSQVQDVVDRWTLAIMNYIEEEELSEPEAHFHQPVAARQRAQPRLRQPQHAMGWSAQRRGAVVRAEDLPRARVGEARALRPLTIAQRQNTPPLYQSMRQEPPIDEGYLRAPNRYSPPGFADDRPTPPVSPFQTYLEAEIPVAAVPVRVPRVRRNLAYPQPEAQIEMVPRVRRPLVPPQPEAQVVREPRRRPALAPARIETQMNREQRVRQTSIPPQPEAPIEREPQARQALLPLRPEAPHTEANNPRPQQTPTNGIRKPLEGGCYVCYEEFESPEDAVWCRFCGQNLHVECFRRWAEGKRAEDVRCAYWYVYSSRVFVCLLIFDICSRTLWI